jgi:arginine repressor
LGEVPSLGHSADPDRRRVTEDVFGVEPSGDTLTVPHTPPGEASAVGLALDRIAWGDVRDTIAGDEAIVEAVKDGTVRRWVVREREKLIATPESPRPDRIRRAVERGHPHPDVVSHA